MMRGKELLLAALALSLVQIGFLSWIIVARAAVLRDGREVLLKVEPVDPRDLLRGDYVRLGYEISRIPVGILVSPPAGRSVTEDEAIYVRLHPEPDGFWRATAARLATPIGTPPAAEDVDLRGTVLAGQHLDADGALRADYGLERFYLPEGEGKPIERDMRVRSFGILAAVGPDGSAQIKALMDEGTKLFEEPLY